MIIPSTVTPTPVETKTTTPFEYTSIALSQVSPTGSLLRGAGDRHTVHRTVPYPLWYFCALAHPWVITGQIERAVENGEMRARYVSSDGIASVLSVSTRYEYLTSVTDRQFKLGHEPSLRSLP